MRVGKFYLLGLVSGFVFCTLSVQATPSLEPTVQISQNGHTFEDLTLLTSATPAYRYYRYRRSTGHPAFGIAKETATISMYWDTVTDALSLLFISGGDDSGRAMMSVTGLPRASALVVDDDPGEFSYSPRKRKLTGDFGYKGSTDGFVLATTDTTSFTARLSLKPSKGIDALRATDGNPTSGGEFLKLNLNEPVYIRVSPAAGQSQGSGGSQGNSGSTGSGTTVGSSVPEPCTLGVFGFVIPLLLRRRVKSITI